MTLRLTQMFDGLNTHVHTVMKQLPISDERLKKSDWH